MARRTVATPWILDYVKVFSDSVTRSASCPFTSTVKYLLSPALVTFTPLLPNHQTGTTERKNSLFWLMVSEGYLPIMRGAWRSSQCGSIW